MRGETLNTGLEYAIEEVERIREQEREAEYEEKHDQELEDEEKSLREELAGLDEELKIDADLSRELELKSDEELNEEEASLRAELAELKTDEELSEEEASLRAELAELNDDTPTLVAINADVTHDKRELASDLAEIDLNKETEDAGFMKRLWKGTLFKKYYQEKYTREYLNEKRTQNIDGEDLTVYDLINRRKDGAISRFIMSVVNDEESFIHKKAGENLVEADAETTTKIKEIIEKFASAPESADENDLKLDFENNIKRFEAEMRDQGRSINSSSVNNYLEVAMQARSYALHNESLGRVMEGFKLYNAEVRDGVRTKAHRDNIDKIVNKLESSKIGQFIPAEILAGAAGIAAALTQTGARAIAGAAGGMLVSSAIAGLKERNRLAEDRARFLRDKANGMEYEKGKYNAEIFGTYYGLQNAKDLTADIEYAMKISNNKEAILESIAAARVRIELSDAEGKDLIAFSSEDKRGKERFDLDVALIRAEKSLSDEDRSNLEAMKEQVRKTITEKNNEQDKDFNRKRAAMALKKAGKTFGLGLATFFISQEVIAAIDPNKIGIFEKAGLLKTNNANNASETLIASGFGASNGTFTETEVVEKVKLRADQEVEIDRLVDNGYNKTIVSEAWTECSDIPNSVQEVSPESLADRLRVKYDGWANNGTGVADGNELRAYLTNGQIVSGMQSGNISVGNQLFDYDELAAAGKIKGYLTVGGTKLEIVSTVNEAGQLTWANNGVFTTTAGETIKAIGDNGEKLYKYFEIAMDNGVDENGIQHIVPFATDVGRDTFDGALQKIVAEPVEHPAVYELTKSLSHQFTRETTNVGIAFAPETARSGLGGPSGQTGEVEK